MVNQVTPNYDRDPGPSAGRRPSTSVLARALVAGTAENILVPADANRVILAGDSLFWANFSGVASVPADTDITGATASLPIQPSTDDISRSFIVAPGANISVFTTGTASVVTASFYKT